MTSEADTPASDLLTAPFAGHRHHTEPAPGASRSLRNQFTERMLHRVLTSKNVVAFTGAGCSMDYGLPNWRGLVHDALKEAVSAAPETGPVRERLHRTKEILGKAREQQADPGLLTHILDEIDEAFPKRNPGLPHFVAKILREGSRTPKEPEPVDGPYEHLLNLPIRRFVTTNSDLRISPKRKSFPSDRDSRRKKPKRNVSGTDW